ncbi:MAG: CehA/McbA family metallohydrolase [Planctomycetes bacterium]|nr:CehA/McbA family metallohydrolase [Planctomycetota bacterium]
MKQLGVLAIVAAAGVAAGAFVARAMSVGPPLVSPAVVALHADVVDDQTGRPLAARVRATDRDGRSVEIAGNHAHVDYLSKRWCYVDGAFSIGIPEGGVQVEIWRGLETRPLQEKVAASSGRVVKKTFRLRRWTNTADEGYVNGDIHAHVPLPAEAHLEMRAEDLNAVTLLAGELGNLTPHFTGKTDPISTPGAEVMVAQEVRDWQMGHLTLLGLSKMVPGYPEVGGVLEDWVRPHWLMAHAMDAARAQAGMVVWSHFCNLPGAESPVAIAAGLVDAIELLTYDDPTHLPSHWGPWKNSGMSQAEFTTMRSMDLYYQYLNSGFQLPIAAGTDKMDVDIPLGSNRTYIPTAGGHQDYASWLAGVKAGKGFITNGPILRFDVDGRQPGDRVNFEAPRTATARVSAQSILPFATLEIMRNGEVVGHKTVFVKDNPPADGVYSMQVECSVTLDRSSWLAARVADDPDNKNRILPRGLSVFAHTNPVYFLRNGSKVREDASIRYLEKYVRGTIHWLETRPPFANPADRDEAVARAQKALAAYRALLPQAGS